MLKIKRPAPSNKSRAQAPRRRWSRRLLLWLAVLTALTLLTSYGISYWYLRRHRREPLALGVTFIADYARYFRLDPQATMAALTDDMGVRRFRLVSYWNKLEPAPGQYDFSDLDWQFRQAERSGAVISLSLGLRQPRWPECHMPEWAQGLPREQWYPRLKEFMTATVNRYKSSPALISYQVENEFFMTIFGRCSDFSRDRLVDEVNLVRRLDPSKPIVVTRSNNWGGVPVNPPTPDIYGVAVYKRVYDYTVTHRYFEYPYPPWFYGFLGGLGEIIHGKPLIIHELQTEPWMPSRLSLNDPATITEQNKSMDAARLTSRFKYATDTGLRTIDAWGAEWWYWRKSVGDDSLWQAAKAVYAGQRVPYSGPGR